MTKMELVQMVGNEEQANLAMELLLKQCKRPLVEMAIKAEIQEIDAQIQEMLTAGYIFYCNGSPRVDWSKETALGGWNQTEEQKAAQNAEFEKCAKADSLIYRLNRVSSMLAIR